MGVKLVNVAVLIVAGAMVADALTHGSTTVAVINALGSAWNNSISAVSGQG